MPDTIRRWIAGGLCAAQLVLLGVVPSADARLEANTLEPHADEEGTHASVHAPGAGSGVHASHPFHDHHLCDLCRALSVPGEPALAPERVARMPLRLLGPTGVPADLPPASLPFLPGGPRAPPLI